MRQKVKRRWFACLWTIFLVFALWTVVSLLGSKSNHSANSSQFKGPEDAKLKLIIVEEHHEVLVPWTEAFASGVLPPNATLVHIDAHSDDGSPEYTPKYPNFRPPKNDEEVDQMMQANDRFIFGAEVTHLVERFIWIYPYWVDEPLYTSYNHQAGTTVYRGERAFCFCSNVNGTFICFVTDESGSAEEPIAVIPRRLCRIRRQTRREVIRDVFARTRLPVDKKWLGKDQLILDIDEDFFGVQLVGSVLKAAGLVWADVESLSNSVGKIMCPLFPPHEAVADRWFVQTIDAAVTECKGTGGPASWCSDARQAAERLFKPFRANKSFSKMFCQWEKSEQVDFMARREFMKMWEILRRLTKAQLLALRRAGVCLKMSMRTIGADPKLHLCMGLNVPNQSAVMEHWPTAPELKQQFQRFRIILEHLPKPRIITLCRSSRDGYVPRSLQAEIERKIVTIIKEVFKLGEADVVYDSLLLNGRQGDWYNRVVEKL